MEVNLIGYVSLYDFLMYFFIYGFLGWCVEVIYATVKTGKFINRGFLNGPICPIYGVGIAISVLLLNTMADRWYLLFIVGGLLATMLEFLTGFVLEKLFNTKWWDYSKEPFNLKGYICLRFSLIWGLAILLVFKTVVPLINALVSVIPFKALGLIILIILLSIFMADLVSTVIQLKRLKQDITELTNVGENLRDGSDKIGEKISGATVTVSEKFKALSEKIKTSRLGKAFPHILKKFESLAQKIGDKIEDIKEKLEK